MGEDTLKLACLALISALATACSAEPSQPLGVRDAIKNIHAMNGQTVIVVGYLGECGGYDCALFENKAAWQRSNQYFATVRATHKLPKFDPPDFLGIGSGKWVCSPSNPDDCYSRVDKMAAPFTNGYVLITGKLSNVCRDEQLRWGCADRGPELEPTSFEKWSPPSEQAS